MNSRNTVEEEEESEEVRKRRGREKGIVITESEIIYM